MVKKFLAFSRSPKIHYPVHISSPMDCIGLSLLKGQKALWR